MMYIINIPAGTLPLTASLDISSAFQIMLNNVYSNTTEVFALAIERGKGRCLL